MYQMNDETALKWMYIFIGRLFFSPNNDGLHVIPVIKGQSSTFKSVTCNVIQAMFRPGSIACIQSTQEQTFGLETFIEKEAIISLDLPEDIQNVLKEDLFKGMG